METCLLERRLNDMLFEILVQIAHPVADMFCACLDVGGTGSTPSPVLQRLDVDPQKRGGFLFGQKLVEG